MPPSRSRHPLRYAFSLMATDWWYGLIPFTLINLLWAVMVLTVVAGPPATAALLYVARESAVGQGTEPSNFFYALRLLFWRAWRFALVTAVGTLVLTADLKYYSDQLAGTGIVYGVGITLLVYVLLLWLELLLLAWPMLVDQPEMRLRHVLRNSAILTLRAPGANLGLALLVLLLTAFSIFFSPLLALGMGALLALLVQHYLNFQAPTLAAFPPRPGEEV
ncbi:MAG: DUF624 domain-containing protein [Chloroflexia bacterium]